MPQCLFILRGKMNKKDDPCWGGYEMVGSKNKKGKKVPNCVPVKENKLQSFHEWLQLKEEKSPAWQRAAGKNKEGGLNEKGRKSYERENPGSDLKAPSKEVGNKRRASFCARMNGMKKKLTSKETASDPDSRINKSLRAWNCNSKNESHIDIAMGKQLDDEGNMALNQLEIIEDAIKKLRNVIKSPDMQLPAWVQAKITLSADYMQSISYYMASKNEK